MREYGPTDSIYDNGVLVTGKDGITREVALTDGNLVRIYKLEGFGTDRVRSRTFEVDVDAGTVTITHDKTATREV